MTNRYEIISTLSKHILGGGSVKVENVPERFSSKIAWLSVEVNPNGVIVQEPGKDIVVWHSGGPTFDLVLSFLYLVPPEMAREEIKKLFPVSVDSTQDLYDNLFG